MSDAEASWKTRTDEEVAQAATLLTHYTEDGERIIRSELRRRGMAEPPETERPREDSGSTVVNRYRDAYRLGTAIVGLGNTIKVVGAVLAALMVLGSVKAGDALGSNAVVAGIFVAAIVSASFWILGVIVSAQGEILRATLDTAVASSPFLSDPERADAMSLPRRVANHSGGRPNRGVQ